MERTILFFKDFNLPGFKILLNELDYNKVARTSIYTGFGLEIYQDLENELQIIADFNEGKLTIVKGFGE